MRVPVVASDKRSKGGLRVTRNMKTWGPLVYGKQSPSFQAPAFKDSHGSSLTQHRCARGFLLPYHCSKQLNTHPFKESLVLAQRAQKRKM
eukprot:5885143-Amphidinium_carterae.1